MLKPIPPFGGDKEAGFAGHAWRGPFGQTIRIFSSWPPS
jgi:hypothetical protein